MLENEIGTHIYNLIKELFPICRSLTGNGVRQTLSILQREIPEIEVYEVPSGTECFDWVVPKEWNITDGYIIDPEGRKFADFKQSNLHVLGYSAPINKTVTLDELQEHLYSLPEQPDAIPFVSSFYKERWGFCLTDNERKSLKPGNYEVHIDSTLEAGHMTYGELIIPGESAEEILISTYLCHPSMANDNLSGVAVTTYLAKWLQGLEKRKYTYRILFIPETIGSIYYLSQHLEHLKEQVAAGFIVTCIGDENGYSYLPSRDGETLADKAALHVLNNTFPEFIKYPYLERGSDERQFCSPGVDLPVASIFRSKYHEYPEYHTSKDDLSLVTAAGLFGGYSAFRNTLLCLEHNETLVTPILCEPHLGKYGLYSTITTMSSKHKAELEIDQWTVSNLLAYCDGKKDLIDIANIIGKKAWELLEIVARLKQEKLVVEVGEADLSPRYAKETLNA